MEDLTANSKIYSYYNGRYNLVDSLQILPGGLPEEVNIDVRHPTLTFAPLYGTVPIPGPNDLTSTNITFTNGGVIALTTPSTVTINMMTFNSMVGIFSIPPLSTVTSNNAFRYITYG